MKNLKDALLGAGRDSSAALALEAAKADVSSKVSEILGSTSLANLQVNSSAKAAFTRSVCRLAFSREFAEEVAATVGEPTESESEDDFVVRAKDSMRSILEAKFLK
jgi:hypothetical protein